ITENAQLDYPPQMLEHEEEHVLEDIKTRLKNQNMDFETYLKFRETEETEFMEHDIRPVAKQRLERSLVVDALIDSEGLKIDQKLLKEHINDVMNDILYSGNVEAMQKEMGREAFSRAISMEGVQRTMNAQVQERLKLIATGQPIPEDIKETEPADENEEASPVDEDEPILEKPSDESLEPEVAEKDDDSHNEPVEEHQEADREESSEEEMPND
ncbi:MAG: hypothetical protein ACK2TV_03575, partial [Anaerolineales bacterium]